MGRQGDRGRFLSLPVRKMSNKKMLILGNPEAKIHLIQMVDDHDLSFIEQEAAYIRELTGGMDFCLKAFRVEDWNRDLSPWPAPAVFGKEDFKGQAADTLTELLQLVPGSGEGSPDAADRRKIFLGGYSLAGLFALWAGSQTDAFDGIAAASPSVWFPGFTDYLKANPLKTDAVYLSLGDKEERTRNPVMARVGDAIRETYDFLQAAKVPCTLEWNQGNHFKEADLRTAKAYAWLMKK